MLKILEDNVFNNFKFDENYMGILDRISSFDFKQIYKSEKVNPYLNLTQTELLDKVSKLHLDNLIFSKLINEGENSHSREIESWKRKIDNNKRKIEQLEEAIGEIRGNAKIAQNEN